MPQMLQKFGDDFPLRKTGNCLEMSELTYAFRTSSLCVIECLLKHGVSMFEKRVESQKMSLHDAMFAFLIISLSENIKKSNDFYLNKIRSIGLYIDNADMHIASWTRCIIRLK